MEVLIVEDQVIWFVIIFFQLLQYKTVLDSSDESDCPCHEKDAGSQSTFIRPILMPLMAMKCNKHQEKHDIECLRKTIVGLDFKEDQVLITLQDDCGINATHCHLDQIWLQPGDDPPMRMAGNVLRRGKSKSFDISHLAAKLAGIELPLVWKNISYVYSQDRFQDKNCFERLALSNDLTQRIFATLMKNENSRSIYLNK